MHEQREDRETLGELVSEPAGWEFGEGTDPYAAAMVAGWSQDAPKSRHSWLIGQAVRLACAYRLGLISAADHAAAVAALNDRFSWLLANHGQPRKPTPAEVTAALAWGVRRAAAMTDDRAAEDLGVAAADAFAVLDMPPGFGRAKGDGTGRADDDQGGADGTGPFTLSEVERVCGAEAADSARRMIERHNTDLWNRQQAGDTTVKNDAPLNYVVTAKQLADAGFGELIETMTAASPDEISAAWAALRSARQSHPGGNTDRNPVSKRWRTLDELACTPPPQWHIEHLLITGTLARLTAPPESLKTFVSLDIALSVATGEPFARSARYKTGRRGHVLYVVGEGLGDFYSRLEAWRISRRLSREKIADAITVLAGAAQFADERDMADMTAKVHETRAVLVIFDTQARCTVGLEENSATAQGAAIKGLDTLRENTGATVMLLHHPNKSNDWDPRGTSAWNGALDTELHLERDGMDLTLTVTKMKDAETGHACALQAVKVDVPEAPRGSLAIQARDPLDAADPDHPAHLLPFDQMTGAGKGFVRQIYELVQAEAVPGVGLTVGQIRESASTNVVTGRRRDGKPKTRKRVCSSSTANEACTLLKRHGWLVPIRTVPGLGHTYFAPKDYPETDPADIAALADDDDGQGSDGE